MNRTGHPYYVKVVFVLLAFGVAAITAAASHKWTLPFPTGQAAAPVPIADFEYDTSVTCSQDSIAFTNLSTGDSLTYEWDFGDPNSAHNTSTDPNPSHYFEGTPGTGMEDFSVILTVTEPDGETHSVTKIIRLNQAPSLSVTSDRTGTDFDDLQYLIVCESGESVFTFYNSSTTVDTNVAYEMDWGDGSEPFSGTEWEQLSHAYPSGIYTITYSVTGPNGCRASKEYGIFVGSNPAVGLGNPGNTNVCGGQTLSFPVTGTENNPEGTIYIVSYSDGSPEEVYNHPPPATVTHTFEESSCGVDSGQFPNSYSVRITATNPCSASSAVVSPIYVSEIPDPEFEAPEVPVCVADEIEIRNLTEFGGEVSNNGQCTDFGKFVWEISPSTGWTLNSGDLGMRPNPEAPNSWMNGTDVLLPVFSEPGTYTIRLITGNRCGVNEEVKTICVNEIPQPDFEVDVQAGCGPITVTTTNTSIIDQSCADTTIFNWSVLYQGDFCGNQADWEFANGTNANSEAPVFSFSNPGRYTISQSLTTSCGTFTSTEEISVFAPPVVDLAEISSFCAPTTITPQANISLCDTTAATYQWTFIGGTPASASTADPGEISFDQPGEKAVILQISAGCGSVSDTVRFSFYEPPVVNAGLDSTICNGESIDLQASITGEGNYSIFWSSDVPATIDNPNAAITTVTPTETTTFTIRVLDNDTGCSSTDEVTISVDPAPTLSFSAENQSICSGGTSADVQLLSDPGTTLAWTAEYGQVTGGIETGTDLIPAMTLVNPTNAPVEVVFTGVITASEQGACAVQPATYTITVLPNLNFQDTTVEICNGEMLNFLPDLHADGARYTWTVLSFGQITGTSDQSQQSPQLTQTLTNTANTPQTAVLEVTPHFENCLGNPFLLTINVTPSPVIGLSDTEQVICSGTFSQEIQLSSNIAGATFSWTATANGAEGVVVSGTTSTIPSQLLINPTTAPIDVTFTISSTAPILGNCPGISATHLITVMPEMSLQEELSDFFGFGLSCAGASDGSITANPQGGDGDYTFEWTGPNGFSASTQTIDGLIAGEYAVLVRDGTGCSITANYTLTAPPALALDLLGSTSIVCAGEATGSIEVGISGGNPAIPYAFEWTKDGAPFPASSQNLTNVPAGEYTLTVFNGPTCPISLAAVTLTEPASTLDIGFSKEDISCYGANDGSIQLELQGGTPPYQISWGFGSSQEAFGDLGPGTYTVTVTDLLGCVKTEAITIEDAPLFAIAPEVNQISCTGRQDGSISLNLQQGGQNYSIRWDHGAETENLFNLPSGNYGVTLTLEDGCQIRQEFTIVEPAELLIEAQVVDALDCTNPQSGEVTAAISGGTPPYSYAWSNGATTAQLANVPAGQYAVVVTDASGCTVSSQMTVQRPRPIAVTNRRNQAVNCDNNEVTEEIELFVAGGTPPYAINWSGGDVSQGGLVMRTVQSGLFTAEITDASGCYFTQSFDINNPQTVVDASASSEAQATYNSHLVNFTIDFQDLSTGDIVERHWDFGDGGTSTEQNPTHAYGSPGTFTVRLYVTDRYGCVSETQLQVEVTDHFLAMPNVFTPNGDGINDHFFPKHILVDKLEFWVLNKWGETIFYTDEVNSPGWDGTYNGEPSAGGNYVYKLNYTTLDGRKETMSDVFMLLR